jgi:hypothetical protein
MTLRDAFTGFVEGLRKAPIPTINPAPEYHPGLQVPVSTQGHSVQVVDTSQPPTQENIPGSWSRGFMPPGRPFAFDSESSFAAQEKENEPRSFQYIASINSTITPRISYGLMAFSDLKTYALTVPEVALCIRVVTEEIKSFVPKIVDSDEKEVDVPELKWMITKPDGFTPWPVWLSRYLFNAMSYDAPAIYKKRRPNTTDQLTFAKMIPETGELEWKCPHCGGKQVFSYQGEAQLLKVYCMYCHGEGPDQLYKEIAHENTLEKSFEANSINGLRIIDGSTIFAVIDMQGEQPVPPAPAFTQVIWGVTRMFMNTHQLWYRPRFLRIDAPYGRTFVEDSLPAVQLLQNLWNYEGAKYITGNIPEMMLSSPPDWKSTDKILEFEDTFNERQAGNTTERAARLRFLPNGVELLGQKDLTFNRESYDVAANTVRTMAGIPKSEVGEAPEGMMGGKGFSETMNSSFFLKAIKPNISNIESLFNETIQENGLDGVFFKLAFPNESLDPEKEEEKWARRWQLQGIPRDTYLAGIGLDPVGGEEGAAYYSGKGDQEGDEGGDLFGGHNTKVPMAGDKIDVLHDPVDVLKNPVPVKAMEPVDLQKAETPVVETPVVEQPLAKYSGVEGDDEKYYGLPVLMDFDAKMPKQGANDSFVVGIGDSQTDSRPGVWKPASGEDEKLKAWVGGDLYCRAEAVYLIDRELAPDSNHYLVPVTFTTTVDGEEGSVQHYVTGNQPKQDVKDYDPKFIEQAAVLDYITNQMDRNHKNYLTHPDTDNRPILIDSDCSFPKAAKMHSSFIDYMRGKPLSSQMIDSIFLLINNRDLWQDLTNLLHDPQLVHDARERAIHLYERRSIDDPAPAKVGAR